MNANFWVYFWILLAAGIASAIAVIPYSLALNPEAAEQAKTNLAAKGSRIPPMLIIILAAAVQSGLLIAVAIYFGLRTSSAVGLRLPLLDALLSGQPLLPVLKTGLVPALIAGLVSGAAIAALEQFYFQPRLPEAFHKAKERMAVWKRVLACFYGGIYEELLLRLFVMSGLIWAISRIFSQSGGGITLGVFWAANILASLLFGIGHLPATARIAPLNPLIISRALILNGLAGLLFGVLFFNNGLEFAVLAHFVVDVLIHVFLGS
jgi:membrane protease YdiL (CAAX protease family)